MRKGLKDLSNIVIFGGLLFVLVIFCGGCSKNEREDIMVSPNNYEEGTDNMELISKEEFIQYYNMSDEEATKYDIEGFIEEKGITSADLEKTHYDVILKNEAMNGVVYGNNVEQYIHYGYRAATKDDNYVEANYIILLKEVPLEEGLIEKKAVVVDLKKYKIYYDCLLNDISTALVTVDITDENISDIVKILNDMHLPEWPENINIRRNDCEYSWMLGIVMNKKDVIRYDGNIPYSTIEYEGVFTQLIDYTDTLKK